MGAGSRVKGQVVAVGIAELQPPKSRARCPGEPHLRKPRPTRAGLRRGVPCRLGARPDPEGLCRGGLRLVRPTLAVIVPALGDSGAAWSQDDANTSWEHIARSPSMSIEKAKRLLGYQPGYSSLEAVFEAVTWLVANGQIDVGDRKLSCQRT